MRSPDGNIRVVKKKTLFERANHWYGWIEIPGYPFRLRGRVFGNPMTFSPNARFLAATECLLGDDRHLESPPSRVVVFDFLTCEEIIAHELNGGITSSLRWTDATNLSIKTFSTIFGASERTWTAASPGATRSMRTPAESERPFETQSIDFENWAWLLMVRAVPSRSVYLITDELIQSGAEILRSGQSFDVLVDEQRLGAGFEAVTSESIGPLPGVGEEGISPAGLITLVPKPREGQDAL